MGKNIKDKKNWNKMKNEKIEKETKKSKKLNNMKKLEKKLIKYIGKKWRDEKIGKNKKNKTF